MSQEQEIRDIDAHLEKHHSTIKSVSTAKAMTTTGVCQYWVIAKPIVVFVSKYLLFWKPKWQTAITTLISVLDSLCPTPTV